MKRFTLKALSLIKLDKQDLKFLIPILFITLVTDLISKTLVFSLQFSAYYICPILNIVKVKNYGISFGLFNENPDIAIYFIVLFDILIIGYLFYCFRSKNNYKHPIFFTNAICLVFSGAVGNLYDRLKYGYVRDFIDMHISSHHWPCYNVADICICIGVAMFVICEIFFRKNNEK